MVGKGLVAQAGWVWHNRYWDHVIRDEKDCICHINYIHYNPVKHRLASCAAAYPHSSLGAYCEAAFYRPDRALAEDFDIDTRFGE